jgi:hypothetical protein
VIRFQHLRVIVCPGKKMGDPVSFFFFLGWRDLLATVHKELVEQVVRPDLRFAFCVFCQRQIFPKPRRHENDGTNLSLNYLYYSADKDGPWFTYLCLAPCSNLYPTLRTTAWSGRAWLKRG